MLKRSWRLLLTLLSLQLGSVAAADELAVQWQESVSDSGYSAVKSDGSARFYLELLPTLAQFGTTRQAAAALQQRLQGFGLTAELSERGYSFNYTDVLPCRALLSYFDGTQYLCCRICGDVTKDDFVRLYQNAARRLGLKAALELQH